MKATDHNKQMMQGAEEKFPKLQLMHFIPRGQTRGYQETKKWGLKAVLQLPSTSPFFAVY